LSDVELREELEPQKKILVKVSGGTGTGRIGLSVRQVRRQEEGRVS
jgi:hypothetical protein